MFDLMSPNDLVPPKGTAPRTRGMAQVVVRSTPKGAKLKDLSQQGSMRVLFPRVVTGALQAVLINTSGGLTGGDHIKIGASALKGAALTLTTQACERAYRATGSTPAVMETELHIGEGAQLNWLPQETLLFDGCHLKRSLTITAAKGARALIVEPIVLGRLAMGEHQVLGQFHDTITLQTEAQSPIYMDAVKLRGDITAQFDQPAIGQGARAMASAVLYAPDAEAYLAQMRAHLDVNKTHADGVLGGASLLAPDLLTIRLLAPNSFYLRKYLMPILQNLSDADLPRPWKL